MIFDEENFPVLPKSWTTVPVEYACLNLPVRTKVPSKSYLQAGALPVIDQGVGLIGGYTDNVSLSVTNELPVVVFGDHTRALKFVDFSFAAGADGVKVLRPNGLFVPKVFYRFLQAVRLPDKGYARHFQHLRSSQVALPPLGEQKRIADKLDSVLARVDACRDRLDRVAPLIKRFRQAVLVAAMSGRLTKDWRMNQSAEGMNAEMLLREVQAIKLKWAADNANHNEARRVARRAKSFGSRNHVAGSLPDGWQWVALEDAALMIVDCHNKTAPYEPQGIPLVRTSNIRQGRLVWEDMRYVSEETYAYWSKRCKPEAGDLVFTREAPMGEIAQIPPGTRVCLGQRTMLFRPVHSLISSRYLLIAISDPTFKSRSESAAVGTGVKHLRVGDVSELLLPIPSAEEQREIVRRVDELFSIADRLEARLTCARTAAERLTPAILAKAFCGGLVAQDPNDEPAAELLKRLQGDRMVVPNGKETSLSRRPQRASHKRAFEDVAA